MTRKAAIALAALAAALSVGSAAAQDAVETQVKAALLSKFGAFVTWPPGAFPGPQAPLNLCVVGHDPFGGMLDASLRGQTVEGRAMVVRRLPVLGPGSGCHIAYLTSGAAGSNERSGVFTVSDTPAAGAALQFVLRANRVRFRIDLRAAKAAGLQVSSKLLNLAVEVLQ